MEEDIKQMFEKGIEETEKKIKLALETKSKVVKELKKLNQELSRKEKARLMYFGEKLKSVKKVKEEKIKPEEKEETKNGS